MNKTLKAEKVHLTIFTSLCFYSGLKVKMGGNVSTSELIAPTMRSSRVVPFNLLHLGDDLDETRQLACFLTLPPHPSTEKDSFSRPFPSPTFVVGCSSPGAGRRLSSCGMAGAGAMHLQGGPGAWACCWGGMGGRTRCAKPTCHGASCLRLR